MAGKVFFSVTMSLDGYVAPEERADDPEHWRRQWLDLQRWILVQRFFRENLGLGEGGEEGRDDDILRETFARTGASVMGRRMFDLGEHAWPEEAPFHTPVFVVTHGRREPWDGRAVTSRVPRLLVLVACLVLVSLASCRPSASMVAGTVIHRERTLPVLRNWGRIVRSSEAWRGRARRIIPNA